jgi:hypothetical protein
MTQKRVTLFALLLSLLLYSLSILLIPILIAFSNLLKAKLDRAYEIYGRDDTVKLVAYFPLFGHFKIIFQTAKRRIKKQR